MLTVVVGARKRSAGLLILSGKRVLLLKRSAGSRNPGRWGLPGGQRDGPEGAYANALRESREELGAVPPHLLVGEAAVQRGARRYELFACRSSRAVRETWRPVLDHEHDAWRWATRKWCLQHPEALHPVLRTLLDDPDGRLWFRRVLGQEHRLRRLPGGRRSSDGLSAQRSA